MRPRKYTYPNDRFGFKMHKGGILLTGNTTYFIHNVMDITS